VAARCETMCTHILATTEIYKKLEAKIAKLLGDPDDAGSLMALK